MASSIDYENDSDYDSGENVFESEFVQEDQRLYSYEIEHDKDPLLNLKGIL